MHNLFSFLPDWLNSVMVTITGPFVGDGWHLTLGVLFMIIIIFVPGGLIEGFRRLSNWSRKVDAETIAAAEHAGEGSK